ncbi:cadherin-23 isoform X2 [Anthonomus grandis grandis]|uniref:cadherin-23 isoform X2 n=1 Tax=Anthonomus grandis grandis TaxID=2921223 RepID=UPI0021665D84|nr:cadherin-23 isoform X2 [Anthonomus grandis grandis]
MLNNEFHKRISSNVPCSFTNRYKETYLFILILVISRTIRVVSCNKPPRFMIDGQTEIVLRLKEGEETPIGTLLYKLKGYDPDGDTLKFGIKPTMDNDVIVVKSISNTEANVYLNKILDREERDEYALVLTLTDGNLGQGNYVTQSLLILVEDVNDNVPIFKSHSSSILLREDAPNGIIAQLEATDADEGPYGQVVYYPAPDLERNLFSITTVGDKAIVKLIGKLDYEKQTVHQIKVLAIDRAKEGKINTGTAVILVKVQDVEDRPPEFVQVTPITRIVENVPVRTTVLQVVAVDGDRGIDNKIQYSLSSNNFENIQDIFEIQKLTGRIVTTSELDREALPIGSNSYILQITATELGSKEKPPPKASTEVTVIISDENDEIPTFKSEFYECEIGENAPINTPLNFIGDGIPEVYDYDQGINGTFELYIRNGQNIFEINPKRATNEAPFTIKVKNSTALDYERIKSLNFTLVAKEVVKHNPKFSEVPVKVYIQDRNDNYPEFVKNSYEVWVPENCDVGTTVAWVQALDDDSGVYGTMGVRYTNIAGSISNLLNLHPVSGIITVKTAGGPSWDREQISKHFLTIEARDDLGNGNRNSVQLTINLEDKNDNSPVFLLKKYEARLLENEMDFHNLLKVEARDADLNGTKNSEISYSLSGELHENFTIDPETGIVKPLSPIDFEFIEGPEEENVRILYLTVRATDWGEPSLFSEVPLLIYVEDVNDNPPVFEQLYYNISISESTESGTDIIQVKAIDLDGSIPYNHLVYRIQKGAYDKFIIDSETGVISVAYGAKLDPDQTQPRKTKYTLIILALDGGQGENQLHAAVTVEIFIFDVNNKNPQFMDVFDLTVPENTAVGTSITQLKATDLDQTANLTYQLDNENCQAINERAIVQNVNCTSYFLINPYNGVLFIAKQIDREQIEEFLIGVIVRDVNSETEIQEDRATLKIRIQDVNDNSPKFFKPFYKFAVQENSKNGIFIGTVKAEDPDKNKTVSYQMDKRSNYFQLVHVGNDSGDIVVASRIDREMVEWLNFTIKAIDAGLPSKSSFVEVFIQILDENDNSPIFSKEPSSLIIPENIQPGTKIAIINATDEDSGEFGKITYILDPISSHRKFSIESDTGILRVAEYLDREEKENYFLIIEAWDNYQYGFNNGDSRNSFKHLNVTLRDVNDNKPDLIVDKTCINITEFHEAGQPITIIRSSDKDDPETLNGQVIIDIADGNQDNLFEVYQISEWSVQIKTTKSLRGKHGNYSLVIRAQDLGTPSFLVEELLHVCVMDYNDHPPVFVSPPHNSTLRVPENATVGSSLVQIIATDEDTGLNGAVRYRLKSDPAGHWKTFNLQPVSGILELRLPLNRKKQKIYDIRIEAYDLGNPTSLSSDLDLTVYVRDINDYQPQFMQDEFVVEFTENKQPGLEIKKLPDTIDRDEFDYTSTPSPICYFLVGGNENGLFNLHPLEHTLQITKPLDREEMDKHLLLVKATEDCSYPPEPRNFFDSDDDTQLKVVVKVLDVNDNPPRFVRRVFTGGVSTATVFGTKFMSVKAEDPDYGKNALVYYYIIGNVQMTLTEGLDHLSRPPFLIEPDTGEVQLNFDPQQGMKGYFDFMVLANDTGGLEDTARVFIYLLREDQRVRFVLRQHAPDLRDKIEVFRDILGNVTGAIVNIDEFRIHANHDGTVDKTRTDLYLHLVDRKDNSILEVADVLRLIDQNTEKLDDLFKDFNVLDTQPGERLVLQSKLETAGTTFWLSASSLFLFLMLLLVLILFATQRHAYQRKLKAATATAYVRADSEIDGRNLSILSGRVPNTNKHSMEGSNPIWLKAYENEWFKGQDNLSTTSDRDSLDENAVCEGESTVSIEQMHQPNNEDFHNENLVNDFFTARQNLYHTLPLPVPQPRKMETTEL